MLRLRRFVIFVVVLGTLSAGAILITDAYLRQVETLPINDEGFDCADRERMRSDIEAGCLIRNGPAPKRSLLNQTPLFIDAVPTLDVGERIVLRVRITRNLRGSVCAQPGSPEPFDLSAVPSHTPYALAEVTSVERGAYREDQVVLCAGNSPEGYEPEQFGLELFQRGGRPCLGLMMR